MHKNDTDRLLYCYTTAQKQELFAHMTRWFGICKSIVYQKDISPLLAIDICIIPPSPEYNWYTLMTMGIGARDMQIPDALSGENLERAELLLCLPPDCVPERDATWAIALLRKLGQKAFFRRTWLGWGQSNDHEAPFTLDTKQCASLLLSAGAYPEEAGVCVLSDHTEINFYQVILLYPEELSFQQNRTTDALLERMTGIVGHVTDLHRRNVCADGEVMDWEGWHVSSIHEKSLPLDEITAYSHMAVYLRWCIEQDLMCPQFALDFPEAVTAVKTGDKHFDLRVLIRDELFGRLLRSLFNETGIAFATYYYDHDHDGDMPCYPSDVDDYALQYFGEEQYASAAFQDEAYLFLPYDETDYQGLKQYIDFYYAKFLACEATTPQEER